MQSLSRKRKTVEAQPAASNFKYPSRFGASFFALIFIALTATATHAQRQMPAPQRPVTPSRNVQLPDALRNRVAVARPIIGKGFVSIPTTANKQVRPQLLTTIQRSQILQVARSGKAQNGAGYAMAQPLAGGSGFARIQGLTSTGAAKRPAPLTNPDEMMVFQYAMNTLVDSPGPVTTITKVNTNLLLTPAVPYVEGKGSLSYAGSEYVSPSEGFAKFSHNGSELWVWFSGPSPGLYVLNLTLADSILPSSILVKPAPPTLSINANGNLPQTLNIAPGSTQVAVPIQVDKANWWYLVKISSTTVDWTFYSCEVISAQ